MMVNPLIKSFYCHNMTQSASFAKGPLPGVRLTAGPGATGRGALSPAPGRRGKNRLTCVRQSHMEAWLSFQEPSELIQPL
jgi:hypothetical protein